MYKRNKTPSKIPNALSVYLRGLFTQLKFLVYEYNSISSAAPVVISYLKNGLFILLNLRTNNN